MSNIITDDNQQVKDDVILKDIEDEEEARTEAPSPSRKRKRGKVPSKRKSTSVHWNNYDKMMVEEGNPPVARTKAKCKECGTLIAADTWNGTNGLKNHTISCLKKKADAEVGSGQTILAYSVDGQSRALTTWKFDQKKFRLGLCKMILLDELPFLFVEREGFQSFMRLVCPQFQIPSRQTIRTDCVQLFLEEKQSLVKLFQKRGMGRVSITTDCWTSVNNNNFICVTAHYIGKDWVLHKKIISFSQIDSHKGDDIGATIVKTLTEWGVNHLFSCTLDNASQNDNAISVILTHKESLTSVWDNYIANFELLSAFTHILDSVSCKYE